MNRSEPHVSVQRLDVVLDYEAATAGLPVVEESMYPTSRGSFSASCTTAVTGKVAIHRASSHAPSVGVTVLDPAHVAFLVARSGNGSLHINGHECSEASVWLPSANHEFYIRGGAREMLGVSVRRERLLQALAALHGVDLEDASIASNHLNFAPAASALLFHRLSRMLDSPNAHDARTWDETVVMMLAEVHCAGGIMSTESDRTRSDAWIVRRAEEYVSAAEPGHVSLADLCLATGVGKTALYRAFHSLCGEAPFTYFRRRRLVRARSLILRSTYERAAIKRCALEAGFRELGRFSREYRHLFGELPSETLSLRT